MVLKGRWEEVSSRILVGEMLAELGRCNFFTLPTAAAEAYGILDEDFNLDEMSDLSTG